MREDEKIVEAEYFYSRMADCEKDLMAYKHNLSAFLSGARSVLQFGLAEAQTKPGGQTWYDGQITGNRIVNFFKDRRDVNIHVAPLDLRKDVNVHIQEGLELRAEVGTVMVDVGQESLSTAPTVHSEPEKQPAASEENTHSEAAKTTVTVTETYRFLEWTGSEDIRTLCGLYLTELHKIVVEGRRRGFLT